MSKYPWHPASRPPPADQSLASNIAAIGRVGKCLEAALNEIQREDEDTLLSANKKKDNDSISDIDEDGEKIAATSLGEDGMSICEFSCSSSVKKRKRTNSRDSDGDTTSNMLKMDKSISKSIMEAYGKAVATTNFDPEAGKIIPSTTMSIKDDNQTITAPAAMLQGEIDHYNRIGDRWRIVLKNASIKPRKTAVITNGMTGQSLRRRLIMDWDDEGNAGKDPRQVDVGGRKKGRRQDNDAEEDVGAYHFKGTVQILAYDDDS